MEVRHTLPYNCLIHFKCDMTNELSFRFMLISFSLQSLIDNMTLRRVNILTSISIYKRFKEIYYNLTDNNPVVTQSTCNFSIDL